ncbi:protein SCAI [Indicator indicator]|uniref:protein SCAI n=1 Tax=Indicator indicator TaxID=1002788 RepID=UPI0023DEC818|nr:protein SCAI [Indicator indicator]
MTETPALLGAERTEAAQEQEAEGAAERSLPMSDRAAGGEPVHCASPLAALWYRPRELTGKAGARCGSLSPAVVETRRRVGRDRSPRRKSGLTVSPGIPPIEAGRGGAWLAQTSARRQPRSAQPEPSWRRRRWRFRLGAGGGSADGERSRPAAPAPHRPDLQVWGAERAGAGHGAGGAARAGGIGGCGRLGAGPVTARPSPLSRPRRAAGPAEKPCRKRKTSGLPQGEICGLPVPGIVQVQLANWSAAESKGLTAGLRSPLLQRTQDLGTEFALKEIMSSGGAEDDIPQAERKTVTDFCYLLDKSKQLFNGLRDLPQYGQKQWQSYFGRTFDVYTKLWKFQQQHRQVLDNRYGLKRWQIGEIASKIGQLYYHYYLRTSETSYLNEAFSFYSAIRQRSYYSQVNKEDRPELVVKKLRYYARFIVVCLLLNKMDVVKDLVKELSDEIEDYTHRFNTEDQVEWNLVLQEVAAFIEADPVMVLNDDNTIVITSNRLSETGAPMLEQGMIVGQLALADALIIGNCNNQVKFSELTIDMFRMLQALEREPMNLASQMNKPGMQESTEKPARRENPHKYLLYKPTFSQLYTFLAASFKELPANSVLLIYLSATGVFPSGRSDSEGPYDFGGVLTNSNRDIINGDAIHKRNQSYKEMHCLHPGDLYPFTRKPLFIIVDSSNSVAYKNFTNLFGQPLVCLLSPTAYPKALQDQSQRGSLFTLFLNNPLMAFLFVSGLSSMRRGLWEKCQDYLRKINRDIAQLLTHSRSIDQSFLQFFGDEFLRLLLTRFIFCSATMRMHKIFRQETRNYPESYPQLPRDETVENPHLQKHILELASILDVRNVFLENTLDDY